MLQRIQTLFLFGIILLVSGLLYVDIWSKETINPSEDAAIKHQELAELNIYSLKISKIGVETSVEEYSTIILQIFCLTSLSLTFVTIFAFRNRKRQIMMGNLNNLLLAALVTFMIFMIQKGEGLIAGTTISTDYKFGIFFPVIAVILGFMANRYIRKDEALVRSMDRIR